MATILQIPLFIRTFPVDYRIYFSSFLFLVRFFALQAKRKEYISSIYQVFNFFSIYARFHNAYIYIYTSHRSKNGKKYKNPRQFIFFISKGSTL